jgi:hypothetical protein
VIPLADQDDFKYANAMLRLLMHSREDMGKFLMHSAVDRLIMSLMPPPVGLLLVYYEYFHKIVGVQSRLFFKSRRKIASQFSSSAYVRIIFE